MTALNAKVLITLLCILHIFHCRVIDNTVLQPNQTAPTNTNELVSATVFGKHNHLLHWMPLWGRAKRVHSHDGSHPMKSTSPRSKRQIYLIGNPWAPIGAYTAFGAPYNPLRMWPVSEWGK